MIESRRAISNDTNNTRNRQRSGSLLAIENGDKSTISKETAENKIDQPNSEQESVESEEQAQTKT